MSNKIQPARGFRDFDPNSKRLKEDLLARIRDAYRSHGFDEIETPVVELSERLRNSEGGENVGMIFQLMRRGLTSEDLRVAQNPSELSDLALRYDLTVPLARFFASNQAELPTVFRAIQIGPVWRAERPQKGRYRQFTQCDIDIIGEPSTLAEIELIITTLAALNTIGLVGSVVRLNDRRFLESLLAGANVQDEFRPRSLIVIDKLEKIGAEGVRTALSEFLPNDVSERLVTTLQSLKTRGAVTIEDFTENIPDTDPDAIADHKAIMSTVRSVSGVESIRFDPTLVRGLGYYTGPIFEVEHALSQSSVAGGGRYDNMIGKFLGQTIPACGFSLGFDRLLEIVSRESVGAVEQKIALIFEPRSDAEIIFQRQQELVANGYAVRLVRASRNMKRLFNDLATAGYRKFQRLGDPLTVLHNVSREE